jgi:hypothetical protein
MTAHELALILLGLPDIDIFVDMGKKEGLKNIKEVVECDCGAEMFITTENY